MDKSYLVVQIVAAAATVGAVGVALWTSQQGRESQRRALQADGRRQAAIEIAQWLQAAEAGILAWHNPDGWTVSEGVEFGPDTGIKPGDIVPPSQGRMGPAVQAVIARFDSIRGLARLTFGPHHEVTGLVREVMSAIQQVADRGVIYSPADGPTPREYVDSTFLPLSADLFEALAEACELRRPGEGVPRTKVSASDNMPRVA